MLAIIAVLVASLFLPVQAEPFPRSLELMDPSDPNYYVSRPLTTPTTLYETYTPRTLAEHDPIMQRRPAIFAQTASASTKRAQTTAARARSVDAHPTTVTMVGRATALSGRARSRMQSRL
jgi:hypothetical protein